jgi:hypothetical protein
VPLPPWSPSSMSLFVANSLQRVTSIGVNFCQEPRSVKGFARYTHGGNPLDGAIPLR